MTQETRETLAKLAEKFEHDHPYGVALRDVLTPRTCGNCKHANTEDMLDGWCHCAAPPPPTDVLFSGPDQVEKWAQKQENGKRFPFWGMAVPLDERCKGWQAREGEGGGK